MFCHTSINPLACVDRIRSLMRRKHTIEKKEPNPDHVTREQVVAHLATLSQFASIREIAHGLELKHHGRRYLPRIMQQLKRDGEVEESRAGRYRLLGEKK